MIRVLVTDGMAESAVVELKTKGFEVVEQFYEPEVLGEKLKEFDVIVVRSKTKVRQPLIDKAVEAGRLKLIIRGGVGVDNIDVAYAKGKGIGVTNTPNASSGSVAELALAHMFAVSRYVNISNVSMRQGKWDNEKYEGVEIGGKTLGLVGFGRISRELAKKASALDMTVIYTNLTGKVNGFDEYEFCKLNDLLKKSDYVSLHIPFIKENGVTIGKDQLAMMKVGAFLINCARGGLIDEVALVEALDNGKLAGAGIDVFADEPTKNEALVNHPKVSVTPHIGGATKETQMRIGSEIVSIICEFFK
ncbi:D-2-hydroxyacid dehydrogenase [Clostridium algoriphilum]|uniref:D-2-hydroxyacid dehydrogenase n=1 Tax=Clostridium algoriphilum TaxID=198347 RepID=UPI001CF39357|nr:D-2-hydroxyacid dehydrogenase [Clostridium algoriphilum]MCB2294760.1 D-2-hydroxyacid dehydrogenase [Clostridium algoriphilum]